eukprot:1056302-Prorocentrum_lima.AAC.1
MPLLQVAAKEAFWDMPLAQLLRLIGYLDLKVTDKTLAGALTALLNSILPGLSAVEMLKIVTK